MRKLAKQDIKREFSTIINETDNEFVKFVKINQWFVDNFDYDYDLQGVENNTVYRAWFRQASVCAGISRAYALVCNTLGIKCEYTNTWMADYTYRDNHAWVHVTVNNTTIPVDVTNLTAGIYTDIRTRIDTDKFPGTGTSWYDGETDSHFDFIESLFLDSSIGGCISYELENDEVITHWEEGIKEVYTYVEAENRWHLVVYEANGEVRWDYDWVEEGVSFYECR